MWCRGWRAYSYKLFNGAMTSKEIIKKIIKLKLEYPQTQEIKKKIYQLQQQLK